MQSPVPPHQPPHSAKKKMRHSESDEPNALDATVEVDHEIHESASQADAPETTTEGGELEDAAHNGDEINYDEEALDINAEIIEDVAEYEIVEHEDDVNEEDNEDVGEEEEEEQSSAMVRISELQANLVAREAQAEAEIHAVEVRCYNDSLLFYKERADLVADVPGFWGRAFTAHMEAEGTLIAEDKDILEYIEFFHIEEEVLEQAWFTVVLNLAENPYISNHELRKHYVRDESAETGYSVSTTIVQWHDGREELEYEDEDTDVTERETQDRGQKRPQHRSKSFFDWFDLESCDSEGWGADPVVELLTAVWRNPIQHESELADHTIDEHGVGEGDEHVEMDDDDAEGQGNDDVENEGAYTNTADEEEENDAGDVQAGDADEVPEYDEGEVNAGSDQSDEETVHYDDNAAVEDDDNVDLDENADVEDEDEAAVYEGVDDALVDEDGAAVQYHEGVDGDVAMDDYAGEEGSAQEHQGHEQDYDDTEQAEADYEAEEPMAVDHEDGAVAERENAAESYEGAVEGEALEYAEGDDDNHINGEEGEMGEYEGVADGVGVEGLEGSGHSQGEGEGEGLVDTEQYVEDAEVANTGEDGELESEAVDAGALQDQVPELSDEQPQTHAEISV